MNEVESAQHLFFECELARLAWFGSDLSMRIPDLNQSDYRIWIAGLISSPKDNLDHNMDPHMDNIIHHHKALVAWLLSETQKIEFLGGIKPCYRGRRPEESICQIKDGFQGTPVSSCFVHDQEKEGYALCIFSHRHQRYRSRSNHRQQYTRVY